MTYLIVWTVLSRNPLLALFGSFIIGTVISSALHLLHHYDGTGYWAMQGACVFLLLHSLRWNDHAHPGSGFLRALTACIWVIQSFAWMNSETARFWMPLLPGAMVLGTCLACRLYQLEWKKFIIPLAALVVMFSGPCCAILASLRTTPVGLLAVIGSFLLFGFGTLAALTRHLWHKHDPNPAATKLQNDPASPH